MDIWSVGCIFAELLELTRIPKPTRWQNMVLFPENKFVIFVCLSTIFLHSTFILWCCILIIVFFCVYVNAFVCMLLTFSVCFPLRSRSALSERSYHAYTEEELRMIFTKNSSHIRLIFDVIGWPAEEDDLSFLDSLTVGLLRELKNPCSTSIKHTKNTKTPQDMNRTEVKVSLFFIVCSITFFQHCLTTFFVYSANNIDYTGSD